MNQIKISSRPKWILFILAFVVYAQTSTYDFAYDDGYAIQNNKYVQKGAKGIKDIFTNDLLSGAFDEDYLIYRGSGGRWRPLAQVTYAIEHELFGQKPGVNHFVNVVIYAFICVLVYQLLFLLFPLSLNGSKLWNFPFIVALLYTLHPIHTEITVNIKGRDELLVMLFGLLAVLKFYKAYTNGKKLSIILAGFFFFLALLSRESGIVFLAIIPLVMYYKSSEDFKKWLPWVGVFVGFAAMYFFLRAPIVATPETADVVHDKLGNPVYGLSTGEQYAAFSHALGYYVKLLVAPYPLTVDYMMDYYTAQPWNVVGIISLLFYASISVWAIIKFKKKTVIGFAILFYMITFSVYSNFFVYNGNLIGERFLFIPSLGFAMALGYGIYLLLKKQSEATKSPIFYLFILICGAYATLTFLRSQDWENNDIFMKATYEVSKNSARSNYMMAQHFYNKALASQDEKSKKDLLNTADFYAQTSNNIYPEYDGSLLLLGDIKVNQGKVDEGLKYMHQVEKISPKTKNLYNSLGTIYGLMKGDLQKAKYYFKKDVSIHTKSFDGYKKLGIVYYNLKNLDSAKIALDSALKYAPGNQEIVGFRSNVIKQIQQRQASGNGN